MFELRAKLSIPIGDTTAGEMGIAQPIPGRSLGPDTSGDGEVIPIGQAFNWFRYQQWLNGYECWMDGGRICRRLIYIWLMVLAFIPSLHAQVINCAQYVSSSGSRQLTNCANAVSALSQGATMDVRTGFNTNVTSPNAVQTWDTDAFSGITQNLDWVCGLSYTVSVNTTIPANVHLLAQPACNFSVNMGVIFTINGSMDGSSSSTHFTGAGTVVMANAITSSQWFGGSVGLSIAAGAGAANAKLEVGGHVTLNTGDRVQIFCTITMAGNSPEADRCFNSNNTIPSGMRTGASYTFEADVNNNDTDVAITNNAVDQISAFTAISGGSHKPLSAFRSISSVAADRWTIAADFPNWSTLGIRITQDSASPAVTGPAFYGIPSSAGSNGFIQVRYPNDSVPSPATPSGAVWAVLQTGAQQMDNNIPIQMYNAARTGTSSIFMGSDDTLHVRAGPNNNIAFDSNGGTTGFYSIAGSLVLNQATAVVSSGQVGLGSTTATTATAGATQAVPATVLGYLIGNVNGTTVKIPYFAN